VDNNALGNKNHTETNHENKQKISLQLIEEITIFNKKTRVPLFVTLRLGKGVLALKVSAGNNEEGVISHP